MILETNSDIQLKHKVLVFTLPIEEAGSGSLVLCNTIVPERTVMNPQSTDAILLALWPDQSYKAKETLINNKKKLGN